MKVIATGDWHACNFTDFSKKYQVYFDNNTGRYTEVSDEEAPLYNTIEMNSRLHNILNGLCDMRDYADENSIEHILMAGDMFHKRGTIDVSVFNAVYRILSTFEPLGIKLHAIAGNHDQIDNSKVPVSAIHTLSDVIHVVETPEVFTIESNNESYQVLAVPYSKDKEYVLDSIKSLRKHLDNKGESILMCHLGITGGKVGSGMYSMNGEYTLSELLCSKWKYLIAGHYHQPQILAENAIYPGTPVQNSFSDEMPSDNDGGYNGFFVLDMSKRYDIHFVPIIAPRFVTVSSVKDLENLDSQFLQENHIRVKSDAKNVDDIKEVLTNILGEEQPEIRLELEKDYSVEQRSDIDVSKSFDETVEIYAKERYTGNVQEAIKVGLDILSEAMVGGV